MDKNIVYDHAKATRRVLRLAATAALATLNIHRAPFASLVTVAMTPAGDPMLLLSRLAVHTQNLSRDPRASLLVVAEGGEHGDPLAGARVTLTGKVERDDDPGLRRRFVARHSESADYARLADFSLYRFVTSGAHLVAGFGRIVDLKRSELLVDTVGAEDLIETESSAIEHMNEDHPETLSLYATKLLGKPAGDWEATGIDPAGVDLRAGSQRARLDFAAPVKTGEALRQVLADLAEEARAEKSA